MNSIDCLYISLFFSNDLLIILRNVAVFPSATVKGRISPYRRTDGAGEVDRGLQRLLHKEQLRIDSRAASARDAMHPAAALQYEHTERIREQARLALRSAQRGQSDESSVPTPRPPAAADRPSSAQRRIAFVSDVGIPNAIPAAFAAVVLAESSPIDSFPAPSDRPSSTAHHATKPMHRAADGLPQLTISMNHPRLTQRTPRGKSSPVGFFQEKVAVPRGKVNKKDDGNRAGNKSSRSAVMDPVLAANSKALLSTFTERFPWKVRPLFLFHFSVRCVSLLCPGDDLSIQRSGVVEHKLMQKTERNYEYKYHR